VDVKQVIAACATVFVQRHQLDPLSAIISIYRNALPRCQYSPRGVEKLESWKVGESGQGVVAFPTLQLSNSPTAVTVVPAWQAKSVSICHRYSCQMLDGGRQGPSRVPRHTL